MELSVIILAWNSERTLERCLAGLMVAVVSLQQPAEVCIVDNGSADGTVSIIRRCAAQYPDIVRPVYLDANRGTTAARNIALRSMTGKRVCILDSDAEISPGTLHHLSGVLEKDGSIGLVVPRLVYPDGRPQISCDSFPTIFSKMRRYLFLKRDEARVNAAGPAVPVDVDYAISACWLLRREAVDAVGLFDEKIFYSPEDVDYCLRLWKAGYRVVFDPTVTVVHHAQEISRGFRLNRALWWHVRGLAYYFAKHGCFIIRPHIAVRGRKSRG